ncbi:MAG: hypothetical protein M0Q44_01475 [Methylobacter sp.]|jgi:hypothetical protein|nr:hypothetical protein [Methylobacter sp.]
MSDLADKAEEQSQSLLDASIQSIRNNSAIQINGTGKCLVCSKKVDPVVLNNVEYMPRWCSVKCRDGGYDE